MFQCYPFSTDFHDFILRLNRNRFSSLVVFSVVSVQKFIGIFIKRLFRPCRGWGGGEKVPTLTYVAHLSGDILNTIYYGSSLQNSPTPHFQGPMASCFDKTLRKAWFLFSFYVRPLKTLWIFKTTQYAPVPIWEHTFKKDLCLHTSIRVGSALKKTCSPDADAKQDNSFCHPDATCRAGL